MIVAFTGTALTSRQRRMLRRAVESNLSRAHASPDAPIGIDVAAELRNGQYSSLWYGGEIATIHYKGWKFEICACGDVRAWLNDKDEARELLYVKDKNNAGRLGEELQRYIRTDKALYAAISGKHSRYSLELDDNNWFECFATDPKGRFYDLVWTLDSDHAIESIAEVITGMDEVIASIARKTG